MTEGRLLVLVDPVQADGYRLAGVSVHVVDSASAAADAVRHALETEHGVVAVHERFWTSLPPALHAAVDARLDPLIVPLPGGEDTEVASRRSAALRSMVAAAVGFELTFDTQGDST